MATENKGDGGRDTTARKTVAAPTATTTAATGPQPQADLAEQVRADHERRTTVPGASNVDARLDNRVGADRPPLEDHPAKPQQVDGPDVMGQVEHTRRVLADRDREAVGERKGMFSPGRHGLGEADQEVSDLKADG